MSKFICLKCQEAFSSNAKMHLSEIPKSICLKYQNAIVSNTKMHLYQCFQYEFSEFLWKSFMYLTNSSDGCRQTERNREAKTAAAADWLMPPPSRPPHRTPRAPSRSHRFLLLLLIFYLCGSSVPGEGWMKHFIKRFVKYCLLFFRSYWLPLVPCHSWFIPVS